MNTSDHGLENTGTSGSDLHPVGAPAQISIHTSNPDLEIPETGDGHPVNVSTLISPVPNPGAETLDIEHAPVKDDPRKWSPLRKVSYLISISTRLGYCMNLLFFFSLECYPGINRFRFFACRDQHHYTEP